MLKTFTIFEDYRQKISQYEDHISDFGLFSDVIGNESFSLEVDGSICVKHYVGFYSSGNTRVQVLPKIYSNTNVRSGGQDEIKESLQFIFELIRHSGYLTHKSLTPQDIADNNGDLLEIFIAIFSREFLNLISGKIHREYISKEENQQFIKGKILFAQTVKHNSGLLHSHFVRFDEYSPNNILNGIFKSMLSLLSRVTNNQENLVRLKSALGYFDEVEEIYLQPDIFKQIKFDRLNHEFEPCLNMCKLFFHNLQPGLSGGKERTFSFMIKLNDLFETYIAKILSDVLVKDYYFQYHAPQYYLAELESNDVFLLKPDFTFSKNGKVIMILDAKYKCILDDEGKVNMSTSDLYQLCTYALGYQVRSLVLIYPVFQGLTRCDPLLAKYIISSAFGDIILQIVQVDVVNDTSEKIKTQLEVLISGTH